jgi:glycosyltransferase involved in cell wall biosynthesis
MNKKKIIHIVDSLCVGGRENVIIDICNNLDKHLYTVYIITLCNDDNEGAKKLNSDVIFLPLPFDLKKIDRGNTFLNFFKVKNKLKNIVKEINPDIIHTHSYFHRLLIIACAIKTLSEEVKCFHTVHTSGMYFSSSSIVNRIKLAVEKYALSLFMPNLVAISEIVQNNNIFFYSKYSRGSRYIPNGIDIDSFQRNNFNSSKLDWNISEDYALITYVARLCEGKNHLTILRAMKVLLNKKKNIKLLLAGDGALKEELVKFVSDNKLENNVIFLGSIDNIAELFSITDIGVFPSEFEGFSLTLIEMMAMELPIVVSDNEIFKKLVVSEFNGMIHPMFDSVALASNILLLLENEQLKTKISKNAKQFSEQFSINRMVLSHEDYYEGR